VKELKELRRHLYRFSVGRNSRKCNKVAQAPFGTRGFFFCFLHFSVKLN
jgi:hypothetical protein